MERIASMTTTLRAAAIVAAFAVLATPGALAWGPSTDTALVSTAARVINNSGEIPLSRLSEMVVSGASVSDADLERIMPGSTTNPLSAIESEMLLLQSVRPRAIDAYFAYRMGVLGKLVGRVTAPMATAPPALRTQYYADVDAAINSINLKPEVRKVVQPDVYFPRVLRQAAERQDLLIRDYQTGLGFGGVARSALPEDASRSVAAIIDVWHTIVLGNVVTANLSQSAVRNYALDSLSFYVKRNNPGQIDAAYARVDELRVRDADLSKRIGDLFFEAGLYERAVNEYRAVLAQDPSRRDVVERIAQYYAQAGETALAEGRLDDAQVAFQEAMNTDKLHPTAQSQLIETDKLIAERQKRLAEVDATILKAQQLENSAEQEAGKRNFAEAIVMLRDALAMYDSVSDEFPDKRQTALTNASNVSSRLQDFSNDMIANIGRFSGSDPVIEAQELASKAVKMENEKILRDLINTEYSTKARELTSKYAEELSSGKLR